MLSETLLIARRTERDNHARISGCMYSARYSCHAVIKLEFSQIPNFMKIHSVGEESFYAEGQTGGQT
jgi:hypothetical protein